MIMPLQERFNRLLVLSFQTFLRALYEHASYLHRQVIIQTKKTPLFPLCYTET